MNEEKQLSQMSALEIFSTGEQAHETVSQEDCLTCSVCNKTFLNKVLYKYHDVRSRSCRICDSKFCDYRLFWEHEMVCHSMNSKRTVNISTYKSNELNREMNEDAKNIVKQIYKDDATDLELPFTIIMRQQNTNTQIESKNVKNLHVIPNVFMRPENIKNIHERETKKGIEMDTIEIINESRIINNKLDKRKSSANKTHSLKYIREDFSIKRNEIVRHVPKEQTSAKLTLPITTTKNDSNVKSVGRDLLLGKGLPIQNVLVKSQNKCTSVTNDINVGQTAIRRAYSVPQPTSKELPKPSKPSVHNVVIGQNNTDHRRMPDKNIKRNYKQINRKHNVQAILRRKGPESTVSKQTLASTPILIKLNLPINIQAPTSQGTEETQKCVLINSSNNVKSILNEKPQKLRVKKRTSICKIISNLSNATRQSKKGMRSINDNLHVGPVKASNINLINKPIQDVVDKSDSNDAYNFNVPNIFNANETNDNGPNLRSTPIGTLIPPLNALLEAQENLAEDSVNRTDNSNELKEMLIDDQEFDRLQLLVEKNKETSLETCSQNKPNLMPSVPPAKTNFDTQNQTLNDNMMKIEIPTEPLDKEMENKLRLKQVIEDGFTQSKSDNDCSDKQAATAHFIVPPELNSVESKDENIECEELKPETLTSNETLGLTAQDSNSQNYITLIKKEINREQVPLISKKEVNKNTLTTDPTRNNGKDSKILPALEVNITQIEVIKKPLTIDPAGNKIKDLKILSVPEVNKTQIEVSKNHLKGNDSKILSDPEVSKARIEISKQPLTADPTGNNGIDSNILPVSETNNTKDVSKILNSKISSQNIQRSINDTFRNAKGVSQKSNSPITKELIIINDSDDDNYEMETLDEQLLESEELLRNDGKTESDQDVIEILDDTDLSEGDAVEDTVKSSGNPFHCKKCDLAFCSYTSMCRHISSKHKGRFCFCNICNPTKGDANRISLISILQHKKNAMKTQTQDYVFYCELCQERFHNVASFNTHKAYCMVQHQNPANNKTYGRFDKKSYQCKQLQTQLGHEAGYCKENVRRAHKLQSYPFRQHTHIYYCDYCRRSFCNKYLLTRHIFGHMGIKPFKCNICKHRFSQQCKLQLHLQRHSKKKKYHCNIISTKIRKPKEDIPSNKMDDEKTVLGDDTNITGQDNTDNEDNHHLQEVAKEKLDDKSSDIEVKDNHNVIKRILRKRKINDCSSQNISKKTTLNKHNKINKTNNSSSEPLTETGKKRNKQTANIRTITTRNKVF